jgi:myosin heavy subunit
LAHQEDVSIEEKILNCNPILEAFGNSKTKRNNNSSRFGKYVRMVVDKRLRKIKGAEIINYLLEKSRIIQQGVQERNFHIFYHMIEGSSTEELTALRLVKDGKRYEYDWFEYLRKA